MSDLVEQVAGQPILCPIQFKFELAEIKKKFGKVNTVVEGIDTKQIDLKDLAKKLKNMLACGGTAKDGKIELQGEHRQKVKGELINLGFPQETIHVK